MTCEGCVKVDTFEVSQAMLTVNITDNNGTLTEMLMVEYLVIHIDGKVF